MTVAFAKPRRKTPLPLPHLKHPKTIAVDTKFNRVQVAEIFGNVFPSSHISKIQNVLEGIREREDLDRDAIWNIYIYQCWKQFQIAVYDKNHAWKLRFQAEVEEMGEDAFMKRYVYGVGGSREDCDRMVDDYLIKRNTEKLIA